MAVENYLVRDVVRLRATTSTDRYGNTVADWSTAARTPLKAWRDQSKEKREVEGRFVTFETLVFAAGTDVLESDRFEFDDDAVNTYRVHGRPNRVHTPQGGEHHVMVDVFTVEG